MKEDSLLVLNLGIPIISMILGYQNSGVTGAFGWGTLGALAAVLTGTYAIEKIKNPLALIQIMAFGVPILGVGGGAWVIAHIVT